MIDYFLDFETGLNPKQEENYTVLLTYFKIKPKKNKVKHLKKLKKKFKNEITKETK